MVRWLLLVIVMLFAAAPLARGQVVFSETILDLSGSSPTYLGTLGAGNSVQGQVTAVAPLFGGAVGGDVVDAFAVTVPAGWRLTSVRVQVTSFSATAPASGRFSCTTGGAAVNAYTFGGTGTSANLVTAANGLAAGDYSFRTESLLPPSPSGGSNAVGYIVTLAALPCEVAPTITAMGKQCRVELGVQGAGAGQSVEIWRSSDPGLLGDLITTLGAGVSTLTDSVAPGSTWTYRARFAAATSPCGIASAYSAGATVQADYPRVANPAYNPTPNGCSVSWTFVGSSIGDEPPTTITVEYRDFHTDHILLSATLPGTATSYTLPASFDPLAGVWSDGLVYWKARTQMVCGGYGSTPVESYCYQFRAVGTLDAATVNAINGPCSVFVFPHLPVGYSAASVVRSGGGAGNVTWNNPPTPYFEDTTTVAGQTYTYTISATGCNTVGGTKTITVVRTMSSAQPSVRVREGQTATLAVPGFSALTPSTITWRRGGLSASDPLSMPVNNGDGGGRVLGAASTVLTIQGFGPDDTDTYWCTVHYPCGDVVSSFNVFIAEGCRADFDRSGRLEVADIFSFLDSWFAGCP